jgi:hypothetical protein
LTVGVGVPESAQGKLEILAFVQVTFESLDDV